jgi:ferredoxin-type protein NapH
MKPYPKSYRTLLPHWLVRFGFMLVGVVLLYAPAALLTRLVLWVTNTPLAADVHRICLRMPIQWLFQPWMYKTMFEQPMYLGAVLVLPAISLFAGPLFCGWLCPAGGLTEYLSRLVPPRFQIDPAGKLSSVPIRYGFTIGMGVAAFVGGNVCCSFCNFAHTQNLISAVFGTTLGISYWSSFLLVSFVLWLVVGGLFTRGGRGWCNFFCPAGALMGLTHWIGGKIGIGRSVKVEDGKCARCESCVSTCPSWAISRHGDAVQVDPHACNGCMDCTKVCGHGAIAYRRNRPRAKQGTVGKTA